MISWYNKGLFMRMFFITLFLVVSCGQDHSAKNPARAPERKPVAPPIVIDREEEIDPADMKRIPDLLPTTYYIARESQTNCKGKYGNVTYNGTERSNVRTMSGEVITSVCTRFMRVLTMEGSAVLKDRGFGPLSVNFSGRVDGESRFHVLDRCVYGEGVKRDLCLLPYHTLAADNEAHKIDDIIFVPKAVGLALPDGSKHNGYFIVRDTGKAFQGIGPKRVDMFTGTDPDYSNVFLSAGFHHKNPMEAYKVTGPSAEVVKDQLREKFGDLY